MPDFQVQALAYVWPPKLNDTTLKSWFIEIVERKLMGFLSFYTSKYKILFNPNSAAINQFNK